LYLSREEKIAMANQQHLEKIFQGLARWNEWRWEHPEIRPDLSEASLGSNEVEGTALMNASLGAFLPCTDFSSAHLQSVRLNGAALFSANFLRADLSHANLSGAELSLANLREANLAGAYLFGTNLTEADLSGADLSGADLDRANLRGANLSGANLTGATLWGTVFDTTRLTETVFDNASLGWTLFANVDLSSARGLETTRHEGPSTLGIDTLFRSQRNLPPARFLSQIGMSPALIEEMLHHAKSGAQTATCSIGYTLADQEYAMLVQASLQARGASCWLVTHGIPLGIPRPTSSLAFFDRYNRLVLVLSQAALESEEIQEEVETALKMETQRQQ
jgi:uncharacterized protein YjbI with pentapeptide repeats